MIPYFALATLLEKLLEQIPGRRFAQSSVNFRPVMAGCRGEKFYPILDRSALGVGGAIVKAANTGE